VVVALLNAIGTDERYLHRLLRQRRRAPILLERHVALQLQPTHHRPPVHDRRAGCREVRNVPAREWRAAGTALLAADGFHAGVVAAYREAEAVLEVEPADLAVGHDVEPELLLQQELAFDAVELDAREVARGHLLRFKSEARFLPRRRTEQAADDVGANAVELAHQSCRTPAAFTACA